MITAFRRAGTRARAIRATGWVAITAIAFALGSSSGGANVRKEASADVAAPSQPTKPAATQAFAGIASFYGDKDEPSGKTASGQKFDENAMTAAHLTLPFGTRLKVTHEGRSVVVTVNDRGPYVKGRVLDLSAGAARAIGITEDKGLGQVVAEVQ
jgi:rare lipoprotein A